MNTRLFSVTTATAILCGCGPSIPENSALQCFNADLYQSGNQYTLANYQDGRLTSTSQVVIDRVEYQQQPAVMVNLRSNSLAHPNQFTPKASLYLQVDAEHTQYLYLATEINNAGDFGLVDRQFTPAAPLSFNLLNAGDELQHHYQAQEKSRAYGVEFNKQVNYLRTTRFVGMETISTPAGEFNTCHLQYTKVVPNDPERQPIVENAWFAQKLGVPVKLASQNGYTQLLLRATIGDDTLSVSKDRFGFFNIPLSAADHRHE